MPLVTTHETTPETAAVKPATPATVKAAKPKTHAKATTKVKVKTKKVSSKSSNGNGRHLTAKALRVMTTLLKAPSPGFLQLDSVVKKSGLDDRAAYHQLWCLRRDGLVKSSKTDGDKDDTATVIFSLTAQGKKIASK